MELKKMCGGMVVDTDELTATADDVVEGYTFLGEGNDEAQSGTLPDMENAAGSPILTNGDVEAPAHRADGILIAKDSEGAVQVALSPPRGRFPGNGAAYVCARPEDLGISSDKIPTGTTLCTIEGTWGADSDFKEKDLKEGKVAYGKEGRVIGEATSYGAVAKTLAAGQSYDIKEGFYESGKVTAKDLESQTKGNATEAGLLSETSAWVNGKEITGKMPDRGSNQISRNVYWYTHTDKKTYMINWMPGGYYRGWQNSNGTMCAEVWLEKKYVDNLVIKACINAFSARGFDSTSGASGYEEQSYTMPMDGTVYYGGASASVFGGRGTTCEIWKNDVRMNNRNIDSSNTYAWRSTMFDQSFAAKKGDVIKVIANCWTGTHAIACIQAVIVC